MKLSLSIVTTVVIAFVVWLAMLWQPNESWEEVHTDYQSLIDHQDIDQDKHQDKHQIDDAKGASEHAITLPDIKTVVRESSRKIEDKVAQVIKLVKQNKTASTPRAGIKKQLQIAGVNRRITLSNSNLLWQEFSGIKHLQRALTVSEFDIYAVYQGFNADYSEADVAIGYESSAMNNSALVTKTLPTGEQVTVLSPGRYKTAQLLNAWNDLDYRRGIVAVIEKHHFVGTVDTTSLTVIYSE